MIKRIALIVLLLSPVWATAQRSEIAMAGGVKAGSGFTGSLGYNFKLWKIQLGAVAEVNMINNMSFRSATNYKTFAPGANLNFIISFPRGYAYPGVAYRYNAGEGTDGSKIKGSEMGVHGGVAIKIIKSLSVNVETGVRAYTFKTELNKFYFDHTGSTFEYKSQAVVSSLSFPVLAGLKWSF